MPSWRRLNPSWLGRTSNWWPIARLWNSSAADIQELFNFAPDGYVVTNLDGEYSGRECCCLPIAQSRGASFDWVSRLPSFLRRRIDAKLYELPLAKPDPSEKAERMEAVLQSFNGTASIPCALRVNAISDVRGVCHWTALVNTGHYRRKWAEERQAKLLELVETVNRAKALPEIYEAAVIAIASVSEQAVHRYRCSLTKTM